MATPSAQQQHQDYFRSVSSESTTYMMVPAGGPSGTRRREAPSKMWVAMVVIVVVVLQIASTTGLFLYLNMSISQVRHAPRSLSELSCCYFVPHVGVLCGKDAFGARSWGETTPAGGHSYTFITLLLCFVHNSCKSERNIDEGL